MDDDFFLVLNASDIPLDFALPRATDPAGRSGDGEVWHLLVDTNDDSAAERGRHGERTHLVPRSLKLFLHTTDKTNTTPPFSLR